MNRTEQKIEKLSGLGEMSCIMFCLAVLLLGIKQTSHYVTCKSCQSHNLLISPETWSERGKVLVAALFV